MSRVEKFVVIGTCVLIVVLAVVLTVVGIRYGGEPEADPCGRGTEAETVG